MPSAPSSAPTLQRLLLTLLPAAVLAVIGASALWGESGLLVRNNLQQNLVEANANLARLERENQRLVRDLQVLERDPLALERLIAEELGWAQEGATIYRFEKGTAVPVPNVPARR